MRVLLDLPLSSGGVGRYAHDLIEGLQMSDASMQIDVLDRSTSRFLGKAFSPWGRSSVMRRAAVIRPDLLHGLHFELPPGRIPRVVTVPDVIPLQHPRSMPYRTHRMLFERTIRRSVKRAAAVIVPSESTRVALATRGIPIDKVVVVPHGVGHQFRRPDEQARKAARGRFAQGFPYVACVSSDKPHKNVMVLPRVAELLSLGGVRVAVAGIFTDAGLERSTEISRYLSDEDLALFLGGAEALLFPSLIEGFGLPALEALACGTPVVSGSGLGALPYIRDAVIEVDVSDPHAIAEAAQLLVATPLRERLSNEGRAIAQRMSVQEMGHRTLDVYRRVLS